MIALGHMRIHMTVGGQIDGVDIGTCKTNSGIHLLSTYINNGPNAFHFAFNDPISHSSLAALPSYGALPQKHPQYHQQKSGVIKA